MNRQISLFSNTGSLPCQYKFERFIGQKVSVMIGAYPFHKTINGIVVGISTYYTDVETEKGLMVATPYNLSERE